MSYTDLTSTFHYKDLAKTNNFDSLALNDDYLKKIQYLYRNPNPVYISSTVIDVENNIATANGTTIIFPDGEVRTVVEATGSGSPKYRRLTMSNTAAFSGTELSGTYPSQASLFGINLLWMYAVKSQVNSSNFILLITQFAPTQANFATLNSDFGTNSWKYLGMIYTNAINAMPYSFKQVGNITLFNQAITDTIDMIGPRYGSIGTSVSSKDQGVSSAWTPMAELLFMVGIVGTGAGTSDGKYDVFASGSSRKYFSGTHNLGSTGTFYGLVWIPASEGIKIVEAAASVCSVINTSVAGWRDAHLGVGGNPVI